MVRTLPSAPFLRSALLGINSILFSDVRAKFQVRTLLRRRCRFVLSRAESADRMVRTFPYAPFLQFLLLVIDFIVSSDVHAKFQVRTLMRWRCADSRVSSRNRKCSSIASSPTLQTLHAHYRNILELPRREDERLPYVSGAVDKIRFPDLSGEYGLVTVVPALPNSLAE